MAHSEPAPGLPPARHLSRPQQVRLILLVVAVVAALALLITLYGRLTAPVEVQAKPLPPGTFKPSADQLADMKLETVGLGQDDSGVAATGVISVDETRSTPVVLPYSGQVAEVMVQAGQHVERGQPLLRIASSDFVEARNQLFAAAAQRASAAAALTAAQQNARRQAAIYQTAGGALKDYTQAQADLVAAQSTARSAEAALGAARDKLALLGKTPAEVNRLEHVSSVAGIYAQTTYHAPVSGTIASRDVAPGQFIGSGETKPVMTIADLSRVWLVAQVPETDVADVHLGDTVAVTTPAYPGRVFQARIDNIGAQLDPDTHRLPVRATVANPDGALKPQMFASFLIRRPHQGSAMVVPADAVIHEGDTARVWVLSPDGLLRSREVTVSDSAAGKETIASGLRPGERIVTSGAIFVNEAGLGG